MLTVGNVITRSQRTVGLHSIMLRTLVRNTRTSDTIITKNTQAIALLTRWLHETDVDEQHETWEYLQRHLDEDRLSDRKLFV